MATSSAHRLLQGSEHPQPKGFKKLQPTDGAQELTVTLMLRRHQGHTQVTPEEVTARPSSRPTREAFTKARGAAQNEIDAVVNFAKRRACKSWTPTPRAGL